MLESEHASGLATMTADETWTPSILTCVRCQYSQSAGTSGSRSFHGMIPLMERVGEQSHQPDFEVAPGHLELAVLGLVCAIQDPEDLILYTTKMCDHCVVELGLQTD